MLSNWLRTGRTWPFSCACKSPVSGDETPSVKQNSYTFHMQNSTQLHALRLSFIFTHAYLNNFVISFPLPHCYYFLLSFWMPHVFIFWFYHMLYYFCSPVTYCNCPSSFFFLYNLFWLNWLMLIRTLLNSPFKSRYILNQITLKINKA